MQQHLNATMIRAVALENTGGLKRGTVGRATGAPIKVPVSTPVLGRLVNGIGEPSDLGQPRRAAKQAAELFGFRSCERLADVAPTLLDLMGLPKPLEMTGESPVRPHVFPEAAALKSGRREHDERPVLATAPRRHHRKSRKLSPGSRDDCAGELVEPMIVSYRHLLHRAPRPCCGKIVPDDRGRGRIDLVG